MARAVGIDLGTTNSSSPSSRAASPRSSRTQRAAHHPLRRRVQQGGEVLVGEIAKHQAVTNVDRTIRSVKRHMGTDWTSRRSTARSTPPRRSARACCRSSSATRRPTSARPITDAVITVPAYFEDHQRQATKEAGEIAGLNVLRIINEPTAAALAYGLDKGKEDETILVFDLGGGTFDVSLLEIGDRRALDPGQGDQRRQPPRWRRLGRAGLNHLLVDKFKASNGIDLTKDKMAMQRLREAAEKAKIELSTASSTNRPAVPLDAEKNPLLLDETLSRAEFERITKDLLDRTRRRSTRSSRTPASRGPRSTTSSWSAARPACRPSPSWSRSSTGGKEPNKGVNPDEVVAVGAVPAGRRPEGRGQGRPAARRHPAVPGHRDQGRRDDQAHRAQHHDPDQAVGDLHRRRQPAVGADPGVPGRARDRGAQQELGMFELTGSPRPARRAADRGHLRHRRERHRQRLGEGPGHRQGARRSPSPAGPLWARRRSTG